MDLFCKILFTILLFFTPFAFAATEPWGFEVVQMGIVAVTLGTLLTRHHFLLTKPLKWVLGMGGLLLFISALQLCFPATLLDGPQNRPLTLIPLYTWYQISWMITWLSCVFFVAQQYPSFEQVRRLAWWLCVAGVLVAFCALSMPNGEYIYRFSGVRGGIGPFMNRNHAGVFFALNALVMLGMFFTGQVEYAKMLAKRQKQFFYTRQTLVALLFVLLSAAVFYTRSRGAMLSWLCGVFGYCFLCFWAVPPQLKKKLKGLFFTLIALLLTAGWITTHTEDINAYAQRATGVSTQTRKMLYRAAWNGVKDYPLFGVGMGAMPVMITSYMEYPLKSYVSHLHCDWLELLLSIGFVGVLGYGILLIGFLFTCLKRFKQLDTKKQFFYASLLSALGVMCVGSVVDYHFFIPANLLAFCVCLALVCAPTFDTHTRQKSVPLWLKALGCVGLLASLYVPIQYTMAWRLSLFGSGLKTEAKLNAYEEALNHYPSPLFAEKLASSYYNASLHTRDREQSSFYRNQAHQVAQTYLERYPKNRKLSRIYLKTHP